MSDLISRKALKKKAFQYETNGKRSAFVVFLSDIEKAKAVDAEPVVHGYWVYDHWCEFKCSNCGCWSNSKPYRGREKYCPNCGARMDKKAGE